MAISSRTPEGLLFKCPVCGNAWPIEPSSMTGDAPCPRCGHLLWWLRERFGDVTLETSFQEMGIDSVQVVELVMAAENELGVNIADEDFEQMRTIGDVIEFLGKRSGNDSGEDTL